MLTQEMPGVRKLESPEEYSEARVEAIGFIFHGIAPNSNGKRPAPRASSNLLHFARCVKLEKAGEGGEIIWFQSIRKAQEHLDGSVGQSHWKWCKLCEREITQRILDEV